MPFAKSLRTMRDFLLFRHYNDNNNDKDKGKKGENDEENLDDVLPLFATPPETLTLTPSCNSNNINANNMYNCACSATKCSCTTSVSCISPISPTSPMSPHIYMQTSTTAAQCRPEDAQQGPQVLPTGLANAIKPVTMATGVVKEGNQRLMNTHCKVDFNSYTDTSALARSVRSSDNLYDNYVVGKKLGSGATGKVYEVQCKVTKKWFACKVMSKEKLKLTKLLSEIHLLSKVRHENVVTFVEYYENKRDMYVITELAKGGELFNVLSTNGSFNETNARSVISPLLRVAHYLHSHKVIHRDIKLENILLRNAPIRLDSMHGAPGSNGYSIDSRDVILCDFGLAKRLRDVRERTFTVCGTHHYVAPEVLQCCGYSIEADLWSIGVLMYMILSDTSPFYGGDTKEICESILSGKYATDDEVWKSVSVEAKDLISKLLNLNPKQRFSSVQALQHGWFTKSTTAPVANE